MVITFKNKQEAFNREAYKKIEEVVGQMPTSFKYNFDNYATGFALLMEEFLKAKNTTELKNEFGQLVPQFEGDWNRINIEKYYNFGI